MCGIVGYVGYREAAPIIIRGLKRLEYRGYDSAGIALLNGCLNIYKKKGKVSDLEEYIKSRNENLHSTIGIGHTRWATHGEPSDENAHPHFSSDKRLAIIHNGIIENYESLKKELIKKGHKFNSETDSEVFVHFIEDIQKNNQYSLEEAVRIAMHHVIGAYAIVLLSQDNPKQLIAARKGSPLVIGVGDREYFIASDASPIIEYTNRVVYLNDFEIATISENKLTIKTIEDKITSPYIENLNLRTLKK